MNESAGEWGLPPPFRVIPPSGEAIPVVVEVPHASVCIDPRTMAYCIASARSVARDADLYVDQLVARVTACGATVLVADRSRYVVDLNRSRNDYDSLAVEGGPLAKAPRGVIWRLTTDHDPVLVAPLARKEYERRIESIYEPYHAALAALVEQTREQFGCAIVFCAHSMPSSGRRGHVDVDLGRADVVPGTQGRSTADANYIQVVEGVCQEFGLSYKHDDPYRGGYSTVHYARPALGVHTIQIELARRLYMNEITLALDVQGAQRMQNFWAELVTRAASASGFAGQK